MHPSNNHNPTDPHSRIMTTVQPCLLHRKHMPESHINHRHHVYPLGEGGPDIEDNIVVVCPTGHVNVHDLLLHYKMYQGNPPYIIVRRYALKEREIAQLGWDRIVRKSM